MSDQWNLVTGLSGSGHKSEDTILLLLGIHSIHVEYVVTFWDRAQRLYLWRVHFESVEVILFRNKK